MYFKKFCSSRMALSVFLWVKTTSHIGQTITLLVVGTLDGSKRCQLVKLLCCCYLLQQDQRARATFYVHVTHFLHPRHLRPRHFRMHACNNHNKGSFVLFWGHCLGQQCPVTSNNWKETMFMTIHKKSALQYWMTQQCK